MRGVGMKSLNSKWNVSEGGQAAGKAAELGPIGALVDFYRLHRVNGNLNREAARDRVHGLRRIHGKHPLSLYCAFDVDLTVRRAYHARHEWQRRLELLLHQRQRRKLRCGKPGGLRGVLLADGGSLLLDFNGLLDDHVGR